MAEEKKGSNRELWLTLATLAFGMIANFVFSNALLTEVLLFSGLIFGAHYVLGHLPERLRLHRARWPTIIFIALAFSWGAWWIYLGEQYQEQEAAKVWGKLNAPCSKNLTSPPGIQFGPENDGVTIMWTGLPNDTPQIPVLTEKFRVDRVNGRLTINTEVRDQDGKVIVEIKDNKWHVNPDPAICWDKNYSSNALEVKDGRGHIVLQLVVYPDKVALQGEWWNEDKNGARILRPYPFSRTKDAPVFVKMTPAFHPYDPSIEPIFKYPSREHLGEYTDWYLADKDKR